MWTLVCFILASCSALSAPTGISDNPNLSQVYPIRIDFEGLVYPRHLQFRKKGQPTWYGQTRYKFEGLNRTWIIELHSYHGLHQLMKKNNTQLNVRYFIQSGCYYKGRVLGEKHSLVKVSLCDGMTGDIDLSSNRYVIHPFPSETDSLRQHHLSHMQYPLPNRRWRPLFEQDVNFCDVKDDLMNHERLLYFGHNISHLEESSHPLVRKKRSESRELHLEVLVVADSKMAHYHGPNLNHYIYTLMSTVALIYKDPSIGNNINIAVVDVIVLNETEDREVIHQIAPVTLRKFCRWQHKHNKADDSHPAHYDTAILITREDLCRSHGACDTLGLAQSGMICDSEGSCAIIEDNGLSAAFTIAHELGHVMSIPHDDDSKCSRFHSNRKKLHVMARMLDYHSHPWSWSECSRQYLTTFFDVGYGRCLMDRPARNRLQQDDEFQQPPGQLYTRDRQCELVFGPRSQICPYMPECRRLWCTLDDSSEGGCRTQHMPWADGTYCGDEKRCHQGECMRLRMAGLTPIDGQWGKWQSFGKCSRSCGGGIQQAFRECDSPNPSNGGRYCIGVRVKYKSCNTEECPFGSQDFRAVQCAEFDNKEIDLPGVPQTRLARWVPQYAGIPSHENCKLYCKMNNSSSYFVLKEKVIDGTTCGLGVFDVCVNGKCELAGCDHILHSGMILDKCGVCGGFNKTCKEIKGHFNETVDYGYHKVVMIPPGASNVRIMQSSPDGNIDDNYIALKDSSENYLLNGDFMISMFPKTIAYNGAIIDYSGSHSVTEHVNCSESLKKDLFVQVLVVGKLQPPNVTFSYTIPLSGTQSYLWKLQTQYSECSRLCNGISALKPICARLSDQHPVDENHCSDIPKPTLQKTRKCNEHCMLQWKNVSKFKCSAECGKGVNHKIIKCMMKEKSSNVANVVPEDHCIHLGTKPKSIEICWGSCQNSSWNYSDWSKCSVSCGKGLQMRSAECLNSEDAKLPDEYCNPSLKNISKTCDLGNCPHWQVGNWTECSVTCGVGVKQRHIWCEHSEKYVDQRYCEDDPFPTTKEICDTGICYDWIVGAWKQCSSSCGNGTSTRDVFCHSSNDEKVSDSFCSKSVRPLSNKSCSSDVPCSSFIKKKHPFRNRLKDWKLSLRTLSDTNIIPEFNQAFWKEGKWSKCSNLCGEGIKRRTVTCHDSTDDSRLSLSYCDLKLKPKSSQRCIGRECSIRWEKGEWSECSVSCGNGVKRRQVVCYNAGEIIPSSLCDINQKPAETVDCNKESCSDWIAKEWSHCSVSCGDGIQRRTVQCLNDDLKEMISSSCDASTKPSEVKSCSKEPCLEFKWFIGPWSQCSSSCGEGIQYRNIGCLNAYGHEVNNERCPSPVPRASQSCTLISCPIWKLSEWSECSRSCEFHDQYRQPYCVREDRIISDENCVEIKPITEQRRCKIPPDCSFKWRRGIWSQCFAPCGKTYKLRDVNCVDNKNNRMPKELCSNQLKPKSKRKCNLKPCPFMWITGQWSECSKTCDKGIRTRSVSCHAVNEYGWVHPDEIKENVKHFCGLRKPKSSESCSLGSCTSGFVWKPDQWQACKGICQNSKQKRKLRCYNYQGKKVPNSKCNPEFKPKKKRPCLSPECPPGSCLEVRRVQDKRHDGNYKIHIKGKIVTLYCHGMNSSHPREFINLRDRNYAVIHSAALGNHFRSDTSERCFAEVNNRFCDCDRSDFGYTIFSKVALNITDLRLITDDFTFSNTYHGKPVSYGTAGDCFQKPDCPQGIFFISLQGTDFRIAAETSWITKNRQGQITLQRTMRDEILKGKCGGSCDICVPNSKTGLVVDLSIPP